MSNGKFCRGSGFLGQGNSRLRDPRFNTTPGTPLGQSMAARRYAVGLFLGQGGKPAKPRDEHWRNRCDCSFSFCVSCASSRLVPSRFLT